MESKELRKIEIFKDGKWVRVKMKELKCGDKFRMFEPDGEPVVGDGQLKGETEFIASLDAYQDAPNSVWVVQVPVKEVLGQGNTEKESAMKTLNNSDVKGAREQVKDIEIFGNGDLFKLISKASSKEEDWMKSTKAMEIPGAGCVVQVTTQQGDQVAEALCFVPGVVIISNEAGTKRRLALPPERTE